MRPGNRCEIDMHAGQNDEVHAAIHGAAFWYGVAGNGVILRVARGGETFGRHAMQPEEQTRDGGSACG